VAERDGGGVPRVDPLAPQGPGRRAYMAFMRSTPGRWVAINGAARIDPALMKLTRGRVSAGMMMPSVNLTTTGAKSGQPRTATVLYFTDGADDTVILIASSFGRDRHPAWYHNLVAHPQATLDAKGATGAYRAEEVMDEAERDRLFGLADRIYPGYADYRVKVAAIGRRIPIMRLRLV
jgi:deazaflavin-dependent oxidoreductase (nitroreductase family)